MNTFSKLLILLALVSACAQTPVKKQSQDWVIQPSTPDQILTIDDQFLEKSQKVETIEENAKASRKTFLHP